MSDLWGDERVLVNNMCRNVAKVWPSAKALLEERRCLSFLYSLARLNIQSRTSCMFLTSNTTIFSGTGRILVVTREVWLIVLLGHRFIHFHYHTSLRTLSTTQIGRWLKSPPSTKKWCTSLKAWWYASSIRSLSISRGSVWRYNCTSPL